MVLCDGCPALVAAHRLGLGCKDRAETCFTTHMPHPTLRPVRKLPAPDTDMGISPETEGFTLLSIRPWHSKDSLKWGSISRPSSADFWSVLSTVWQIGELLWGV